MKEFIRFAVLRFHFASLLALPRCGSRCVGPAHSIPSALPAAPPYGLPLAVYLRFAPVLCLSDDMSELLAAPPFGAAYRKLSRIAPVPTVGHLPPFGLQSLFSSLGCSFYKQGDRAPRA